MSHSIDGVLQAAAIESLVIGDCEAVPGKTAGETYAMPATQGQLRFWSLDQLVPGNPALNMPLMWKCTGDLNVRALAKAFTLCVARHESLRTTFSLIGGKLSQIIHPPSPVELAVVDLEPLQGESQQIEADHLTREHAAYRFDLKHGPLLTLKLLQFDARHSLLLVSMHHIICDGISNGILMRDMRVYYESILAGTQPELPKLPIQFADYAVWHEEWLAGPEPAESLEFWHQSLGHDFSRLTVRRDEDALAALADGRDVTGDIETLQIPQDLQVKAHAFCKRENVTLNILLFSIFAALMNRVTGQQDLVIGSPCANRNEDTEELIGLFMNIQVMRVRLQERETFRSLLGQVQAWTLGAYENQSLPFETLVHDPYFSNGSNSFEIPIFFLYQKSFMVTHQIGDLEIVPLRSESPGAVFDMMFAIVDRAEDGPRLQLEYNPRHFKATTIRRYLRMFNSLLESALADPELLVGELRLFETLERTTVVTDWNQTSATLIGQLNTPAITDDYVAPHDVIERQLADIWQTTLGIPLISVRDSFFSLGAGSLAALRLITKMNRVYAMELGLASLITASTIESIAELIRTRFAPNTDSSVVPLQPHGTRPPLFIVHGVGGNVVNFYGLSMRVGADQPVYGIQSQALVANQPALLHLTDMATHYIADIRRVQPRGPYHLLGYSFGGTVTLEMAHQLRAAGEEVALVGMIDSKSKDYEEQLTSLTSVQTKINRRMNRFVGNTDRLDWKSRGKYIHAKITTRAIRFACMAAAALHMKHVPTFMRSAYDINYVAVQNYKVRPYNGKLVLFRASYQGEEEGEYDLGWSAIFKQGVEIHDLPGDHERIFLEPNIDQLAGSLRESLARA